MVWLRLLLKDDWLNSARRSVMRPYAVSTSRTTSSSDCACAGPAAARISASAATTLIMPPLYTRVTAVPERVPAILALDFDGVLCDGMREYFTAAWRAWRRLRPSIALDPPSGLFERFARVRPVVESGWEMPLVIMALLAGASESELLERWRPAPLRRPARSGSSRTGWRRWRR